MTNSITNTHVQANVQMARNQTVQSPAPAPKASQTKAPVTNTLQADTVQISSAAVLAMKEAMETPAQTSQEASRGDRQAQRLLAKETADAKL